MSETIIHLCATPGCFGIVDDPDNEPCPRCGRIKNDPTPEELEADLRRMVEGVRRDLRRARWYQNPEP